MALSEKLYLAPDCFMAPMFQKKHVKPIVFWNFFIREIQAARQQGKFDAKNKKILPKWKKPGTYENCIKILAKNQFSHLC